MTNANVNANDTWKLGKYEFTSRFILGSGKYSHELIKAAVQQAQAQIVTLALRRVNVGGMANILDFIPENVKLLPNTSGARNADEAVRIARLSREICDSDLVKIEIMRDSKYLLPDNQETITKGSLALRIISGGFIIGPKDGGYFISLTDETFIDLISAYLRPATKKILFG